MATTTYDKPVTQGAALRLLLAGHVGLNYDEARLVLKMASDLADRSRQVIITATEMA